MELNQEAEDKGATDLVCQDQSARTYRRVENRAHWLWKGRWKIPIVQHFTAVVA